MRELHRVLTRTSSAESNSHRVASYPEWSARNALRAQNGVSTRQFNFFLAIPNSSGKVPNLSGKKRGLEFSRIGSSGKREARNLPGQVHPAKKEAWNFAGQVHPARKESWDFPDRFVRQKKKLGILPDKFGNFAARFIPKRDMFGIAKGSFVAQCKSLESTD